MNETLRNSEDDPLAQSREIAGLLETYGVSYGFDSETLHEIAAMPFEEAFETAYSYVSQVGIDADELLAPWIEVPSEEE